MVGFVFQYMYSFVFPVRVNYRLHGHGTEKENIRLYSIHIQMYMGGHCSNVNLLLQIGQQENKVLLVRFVTLAMHTAQALLQSISGSHYVEHKRINTDKFGQCLETCMLCFNHGH